MAQSATSTGMTTSVGTRRIEDALLFQKIHGSGHAAQKDVPISEEPDAEILAHVGRVCRSPFLKKGASVKSKVFRRVIGGQIGACVARVSYQIMQGFAHPRFDLRDDDVVDRQRRRRGVHLDKDIERRLRRCRDRQRHERKIEGREFLPHGRDLVGNIIPFVLSLDGFARPFAKIGLRADVRGEQVQRDHAPLPLLSWLIGPKGPEFLVVVFFPSGNRIDVKGQPTFFLGREDQEERPVLIVVVQPAPQRREPLLTIEKMLGHPLARVRCALQRPRNERFLAADLKDKAGADR